MTPIVDPADFPAARTCVYLNAANVALMYRGADEATAAWQRDVAENGSNHFDEAAEEGVFDGLHHAAARLFNAAPDDIAGGSSATELLGSLAWAVMPAVGTNVVSTDIAFPSAVYPWMRVARHTGCEIRLVKARDGYVDPDELAARIDDDTAVVCLSHVEYRSGQRYDLARFADIAHARGALLVVDATQSAGAVPIDAPGSGVDAVVSGAYKWLCGPFGAAVMYVAPRLQTALEPGLVGFRSHKAIWDIRADRIEYPETARRFEFSTMAYGCAIGLTRAIEYLMHIGVERIFEYNKTLADHLIDGLHARGLEITSPRNASERSAIVTARAPGADSAVIVRKLKDANVRVACRQGIIRFSPHLYNTKTDIDTALDRIESL